MTLRDAYYTHLADPGPESWRAICRLLSDKKVPASALVAEARELKRELAAWPPEVERPKPDRWPSVGATPPYTSKSSVVTRSASRSAISRNAAAGALVGAA